MLVSTGFPRSGNHFLNHLLRTSFPGKIKNEVTHNIKTLEIPGCIVPVRNPYESIPSWSKFCNEPDIDGISRWYLRFNKKILDNIDSLFVVDFNQLTENPLAIVNKVSDRFNLTAYEVDVNKLHKNSNIKKYNTYDSKLIKECYDVYNQIRGKL